MKNKKGFTMLSQQEIIYIQDIIEELMTLADPSEFLEEEVQQALDLLQNAETISVETYLDLNQELETMENRTETVSMTDEQVLAFAEKILTHIDKDGVISAEGRAILEDKNNLPSEADQIKIMQIIKERVNNGQKTSGSDEKDSQVEEKAGESVPGASESPTAEDPQEGEAETAVQEEGPTTA